MWQATFDGSPAERRLDRFWGEVDRKQIELIAPWLRGPRVLDLGCGYGTLTAAASLDYGLECTGIDRDEESLESARRRFGGCEFTNADAEALPFEAATYDTVVLRDTLHHLVNEGGWRQASAELLRVSKPDARLVVFDPNVHRLLRLARRLSGHVDEECPFERAVPIVEGLGYRPVHTRFHALFSLPLSGGYVGPELVPNRPLLGKLVLRADDALDRLIHRLGLARRLAWRYLIVGERQPA